MELRSIICSVLASMLMLAPELASGSSEVVARSTIPEPSRPLACPRGSTRCVELDLERLMTHAIYFGGGAKQLEAQLRAVAFDSPGGASLGFCIDPASGKVGAVRVTGAALHGQRVARLRKELERWRFRPLSVDGVRRMACTVWAVGPGAPPVPAEVIAPLPFQPARALWTPAPTEALRGSWLSRQARRETVTTKVSYCVMPTGKVAEVRTRRRSGDARLDQSIREEVLKWRFRPAHLGQQPVQTCFSHTFVLLFLAAKPHISTMLWAWRYGWYGWSSWYW